MLILLREVLKWLTSPVLAFAVFLACTVILLLPHRLQSFLKLDSLERYRGFVAAAAILAAAVLAAHLLSFAWKRIPRSFAKRKLKNSRIGILTRLTPKEKGTLLAFLDSDCLVMYFSTRDQSVTALRSKQILLTHDVLDENVLGATHLSLSMADWARELLERDRSPLRGNIDPDQLPYYHS